MLVKAIYADSEQYSSNRRMAVLESFLIHVFTFNFPHISVSSYLIKGQASYLFYFSIFKTICLKQSIQVYIMLSMTLNDNLLLFRHI